MKTQWVMIGSAFFMGLMGLLLTFMPQEIMAAFNMPAGDYIFLQMLGALYMGFAVLNFMAKGNIIGGIYSKPVAIGNLTHFFVGGMALVKIAILPGTAAIVYALTVLFGVFALLFGYIAFTHPKAK